MPSTGYGLVGLALSGGGIRSAALSLGVMQALADHDVDAGDDAAGDRNFLSHVDYVSTVSGGGLIGSTVSAVLDDKEFSTKNDRFPLAFRRGQLEGPALRHLRRYSNYLQPGGILDTIRLPAVILRGILNNLAILLPFLLIAAQLTELVSTFIHPIIDVAGFWVPVALALTFVVVVLFENVLYRLFPSMFNWGFRDSYERLFSAALLMLLVVTVLVVPSLLLVELAIDDDIRDLTGAEFWQNLWVWAAVASALVLITIAGKISGAFGKLRDKVLVWLVGPFSYAVVFGLYLLLVLYHVDSPILGPAPVDEDGEEIVQVQAQNFIDAVGRPLDADIPGDENILETFEYKEILLDDTATVQEAPNRRASAAWLVTGAPRDVRVEYYEDKDELRLDSFLPSLIFDGPEEWYFLGGGILGLLYAFVFSNPNFTSARGYFRDRISRAFVFMLKNGVVGPRDRLKLSALNEPSTVAPYHLINATLNMQGESDRTRVQREAGFFILSRHFVGGPDTGYCRTEAIEKFDKKLNLATAVAISGAGLSPNMGVMTVKSLVFLLTLLNLRLDYWLPNPEVVRPDSEIRYRRLRHFRLLLAVGPLYLLDEALGRLNAQGTYVNVSDGGQIENLAVYELLRRRSKWIIAVDGDEDPDMKFVCLTQLMQFAMVDMGIEIRIKLDELLPQGPDGYSQRQWTVAEIDYGSDEIGYLIFIKSALTEETPVNLRQFRSTDPKFPQTPSSDQFFTEAQFEAYRELGWFIGSDMLNSDDEFVTGMLDQLVRSGPVPLGPVPPANPEGAESPGASA